MIVLERPGQLDAERYRRIVEEHEPVTVAPLLLDAVDAERARMLSHLESGATAYGVNTGVGYLAGTPIGPGEQRAFQRSILLRGAGQGPPFAPAVVRGAMLIRLAGFLSGRAAVSAALCRFIADRLNDGWTPSVPARGVSSAGEVIALSHLFQTFAGEGTVLEQEAELGAADALARRGVAPYEPGLKEGIALVNGAPLAPALAAWLGARCALLLDHATVAGALTAALAGCSLRPYSQRIGRLKGDPAQERVHAQLAHLHGGAADWCDRPQHPVSFRVLPQVHGAVAELVERLREQVARELRAVTDSPLYLRAHHDEPEGFYPSGNFHSQALNLGLDALKIGFAQVGNLCERRLHRLLDRRFSGLNDQLADAPGRQTGVVFAHKSVLGFAAENRMLAAPASVHQLDASAGQEDFQAFTLLAGEQLGRLLDNLELMLAAELVAIRQARHLRGAPLPPRLEAVVEQIADTVAPVGDDRSLSDDVRRAAELIRSGALVRSQA
ncbi:MAG TPA: aromatic amino acid lyase [Solirubrobacteraceae bacterium]|nr:aromatic amino acid lyase [Solirubrobacteraceae bacterium]